MVVLVYFPEWLFLRFPVFVLCCTNWTGLIVLVATRPCILRASNDGIFFFFSFFFCQMGAWGGVSVENGARTGEVVFHSLDTSRIILYICLVVATCHVPPCESMVLEVHGPENIVEYFFHKHRQTSTKIAASRGYIYICYVLPFCHKYPPLR